MTPRLLSDLARVCRRDAEAIQREASARPPWVMTRMAPKTHALELAISDLQETLGMFEENEES